MLNIPAPSPLTIARRSSMKHKLFSLEHQALADLETQRVQAPIAFALVFLTVLLSLFPTMGHATNYFLSAEESYSSDSALPTSIFQPETGDGAIDTAYRTGHTRSVTGNPKGSKVLEWQTTSSGWVGGPNPPYQPDILNYLTYGTTPPNGGTLYLATFVKLIRINGIDVWTVGGDNFDKAMELVGPNYRWTLNFGIRDQPGPAHSWSIFVTNPNPGHFNPSCEYFDNYWQNYNSYGGAHNDSTPCQPTMSNPYYPMSYDRWYAVVFKVTFSGTTSGEVSLWINGTQVMRYTNIITCGTAATSCAHSRPQLFGTYSQPRYAGPAHKRQLDALIVTNDLTYLQNNGYFSPPQDSGGSTSPPPAPANLRVQ